MVRTKAQNNLGVHYYKGLGVPQDYVEAHMWWNLAASQGQENARSNRDLVAKEMTPAQLAEAQKRAREFRPVPEDASTRKQPEIPAQQIASTGTGFFVTNVGHILTNKHVINECQAVQIRLPGGSAVGAEVLHTNADVDLAVLKTEPSLAKQGMHWSGKAVEFRTEDTPRLGEGVVVYGFPLAGSLSSEGNVTAGNITALAGPGDDDRLYQISAPVQPGNSGGPLFDESGRVVGIVVAKLDALKMAVATGDIPQNVNFAIKSGIATSFLGLYRIPYTASAKPAQKSQSTADVAENAQRYTVRVECLQ
ncbi:MAG: trypsin-like peptidase domain-containing protein [Pseudomonadota bacterium]